MDAVIILIHSPLVGPFTWELTAARLRSQGAQVAVPRLESPPSSPIPYWQLHERAVRQSLEAVPEDAPILLVAHSGAGPLLPAVRQGLPHPIAGYLFVDAGWPENGKSRLDLFDDPAGAEQFRQSAQNGLLPVWSEEDLRPVIPDDAIRRRFARELNPLPLAVYEETLPVFTGWPDAPCAYLRFGDNPAYDQSSALAHRAGFSVERLEGQHFHMLVEPAEVADALIRLASAFLPR